MGYVVWVAFIPKYIICTSYSLHSPLYLNSQYRLLNLSPAQLQNCKEMQNIDPTGTHVAGSHAHFIIIALRAEWDPATAGNMWLAMYFSAVYCIHYFPNNDSIFCPGLKISMIKKP